MRALSLVPVTYVVCGLIYLGAGGPSDWPFAVVAGTAMLASIYLVIASVVHVLRNPALHANERITWLVLALVMGFITLPVYWFSIVPRTKTRSV
jgi:RsiW-degrading membrane proteinase PrsW (M82 family)